jgi:hypothetical protein
VGTDLEVVVDGHPLSLECRYGDVQKSTVWPGGSDELSWSLGTQPARRFRGGETVAAMCGGVAVWSGSLIEPDPSQDQMTAQGAFREGDGFIALTSGGAATAVPDTAIDHAISVGLRWTRPATISAAATEADISGGPVMVGDLLDTWAENNTKRWGVNPAREVYAATDPTTPAYQVWSLDGGLGYALDSYASTLYGRYLDSTSGTYKTVGPVTDADARDAHGPAETTVDLSSRGPISSTRAAQILKNLLLLGAATPQWTANIEVSQGDLLSMGGVPVALELVAAGQMVRVHGGYELAMRQNGAMYVDVLIGQTTLSGGTLTLQPFHVATRSLTDALALAVSKKKK